MNTEHIYTLINKYWDCETSVAEEKELRTFFSGNAVPEDLKQFIPLFEYIVQEKSVSLSPDFDARLQAALEKESPKTKNVSISTFAPIMRIAASVLLIIGLGVSLFFIFKENNNPYFADTSTSHNTNDALLEATYALEKLSDALQLSESASIKTIQHIEDLDIDWASLDSLHRMDKETEINKDKISL